VKVLILWVCFRLIKTFKKNLGTATWNYTAKAQRSS